MPTHDTLAQLRQSAAKAPMLTAEREGELLRRIEKNDGAALEELLSSHLRLVLSVAARFSRRGLSELELVAEGNLGLVEAARRFDHSRGTRFATYAAWWVRARISRFALDNRRIVGAPSTRDARRLLAGMRRAEREICQATGYAPTRSQIAEATGTREEDVALVQTALAGRDVPVGPRGEDGTMELRATDPSPEQLVAEDEETRLRIEQVRAALGQLDGRERDIVSRRLLADEEETLSAVGRAHHLSRERVRQLEMRAKHKLRAALRVVA